MDTVKIVYFSSDMDLQLIVLSIGRQNSTFNFYVPDLISVDVYGITGKIQIEWNIRIYSSVNFKSCDYQFVEVFTSPSVNVVSVDYS